MAALPVPVVAPLTISLWCMSFTANTVAISLSSLTAASRYVLLPDGTFKAGFFATDGTNSQSATSAIGGASGQWMHLTGVVYANNSRAVFYNGRSKATSVLAITPTGITHVLIGAQAPSGVEGGHFNGFIAEVAIWAAALSDREVAALPWTTPNKVRPNLLRGYWPLDTAAVINKSGFSLPAMVASANGPLPRGPRPPSSPSILRLGQSLDRDIYLPRYEPISTGPVFGRRNLTQYGNRYGARQVRDYNNG